MSAKNVLEKMTKNQTIDLIIYMTSEKGISPEEMFGEMLKKSVGESK